MVIKMSSSRINSYKEEAKAEMIRCNGRQIRCPCRSCKLVRWIDPDSGQLEEHLLRRGFMEGFNRSAGQQMLRLKTRADKMIVTKEMSTDMAVS